MAILFLTGCCMHLRLTGRRVLGVFCVLFFSYRFPVGKLGGDGGPLFF